MRLEPLIAKKFEMKGSEKSRQSLLDEKVNIFIKLDVAIDLISDEIAQVNEKYNDTKDERYNLKLNELLNKREEIYNGNINIINEIGKKTIGEKNFFEEKFINSCNLSIKYN